MVFLSSDWLHVINQNLVSYHGSPFNTVEDNSIHLSNALGTSFSHWPSFHRFIWGVLASAVGVICAVCRAISGQKSRVGGALGILSVWMEERIFFWCPAKVTPTRRRSLQDKAIHEWLAGCQLHVTTETRVQFLYVLGVEL